jgi:hypothetical protein
MGSNNNSVSGPNSGSVADLCERFWALDLVRVDLDQRLTELPDGDQRRDVLWQELEAVLPRISDIVARLATVTSAQPKDLGARALVLGRLLRIGDTNPPALDAGTIALAISLADAVAMFTHNASRDGLEDTKSATSSSMIS